MGGDNWLEDEGCEGHRGGNHGCCISGVEEDWRLQARWDAQHEAEEEARHTCTQGSEPIHQGAMRLQGKACLEDREGPRHEEAQGGHQLSVWAEAQVRKSALCEMGAAG